MGIGFLLDSSEAIDAIERLGLNYKDVYKGEALLTNEYCNTLLNLKLDIAITDVQTHWYQISIHTLRTYRM